MVTGRLAWTADIRRLDRERIVRGLSQRELAALARVDPGTLSDLLAQRRRPNLGTLRALSEALELGIADLIQFES